MWSACVRNDMTICNLDGVNPLRQEFMENECEALPDVAYPGVRDNRSTINTKTGYDDDMMNGKSRCCNNTSTDVLLTSLLTKNI